MSYLNLQEVRELAKELHKDSKLYGPFPYSFHLYSVELMVCKFKHLLEDELSSKFDLEPQILRLREAAWLHDSIEDVDGVTTEFLLDKGVHPVTVSLVDCVTDGKEGKNRLERHERAFKLIQKNFYATYLKLCDRIVNVEFSLLANEKLVGMYRKEHEHFRSWLHVHHNNPFEPMWDHLSNLLYGDKNEKRDQAKG